jgi:RNA polymerase sigma-70 factor (ECF subfamily)
MSTVTMPKPTADNPVEFESWFREYHLLVYRTACVVTGSPEDAEDVLQTIFLRLIRRAAPPDIRKNPKGYFYKAAVHLSLDLIRLRQREVLTSDFAPIEGRIRPNDSDSQSRLDNGRHRPPLQLTELLSTLAPRTVEIVMLRYVDDCTEREIAKLLRISRGTVAVTLFRARIRLRKLLRASSTGGQI